MTRMLGLVWDLAAGGFRKMNIFDAMELMFPYDSQEGGGWWLFKLPADHKFQPAFNCHDRQYKELIAGTSRKTLKQIDREFLRNMLRIAAAQNWFRGTNGAIDYVAQAWTYYRIARLWAKTVRARLEAFRPGKN